MKGRNVSGKQWLASLFAALILALAMSSMAFAAVKIPTKVRIWPGEITEDGLSFNLPYKGDRVKNLKGSGGLKVKITQMDISASDLTNVTLCCYAAKTGSYKITFDIYKKNGKKRTSKSIAVYCKKGEPFKKVLLNGKDINESSYVTGKTGKIRVIMNPGYKLIKIRIGKTVVKKTEDGGKMSEWNFTRISNGSSFSYGKTRSLDSSKNGKVGDDYFYSSWSRYLFPETLVEITYKDKFSGRWVARDYWLTKVG